MKKNRLTRLVCWMLMGAFACAGGDGEDVQPSDMPAWESHDSDTPPTTAEELRQRRLVPGHTEVVAWDGPETLDAGTEPEQVGIARPDGLVNKLTWPSGYGIKSATNAVRCWTNGSNICDRPKAKTFRMRFRASTCNAAWNTHVFTHHTSWVQSMAARGWTVQGPSGSSADYYIDCAVIAGTRHGEFQAGGYEQDANGDYTWKSGTVRLDAAKVDSYLTGFTQEQKNYYIGNLIWHELLHVVGLGHSDGMSFSKIMLAGCGTQCMDGYLIYNSTEVNWLNTYVP